MRQIRADPTLRYGLTAAIVNATLLGVDQAIRAVRPAIIQSPQGHSVLNISFFGSVALVTLAAGYLTARETGRVKAALWAGALAVGLPAALLAIVLSVRTVAAHNNQLETTDSIKTGPTTYLFNGPNACYTGAWQARR